MGYNLYITRKENWLDEGKDITSDEWLAIVDKDPELSICESNGSDVVIWRPLQSDEEYWLSWMDGNISASLPEEKFVHKMVEIAKLLNAVVQGMEGEIYDENYRENDEQINIGTEKIKHTVNENKEIINISSWIKRIFGKS